MTELRNYILSKLQERIEQGKIDFPKTTIAGRAARQSAAKVLPEIKAMYAKSGLATRPGEPARATREYIRGTYRLKGDPKPKPENSSTDLRTQLAYVLADKLEELKLPVGGIPRDASGRVSRDARRMVAAGGVAIARSGKVPDKPISPDESGVVDLDKFDRTNWRAATPPEKSAAGKFAVTSRERTGVTLAPRPERLKRPKREDSSTNLKDRMVDIIIESYLNKLDETSPTGSVADLRRKLGLGYKSNPKHKGTPIGQDARDLDAAAMRAARNPDSEEAKTSRQIHADARSSEDPPSRSGGGGTRPSRYTDNHPSLTDSERNSGHRFNRSRSGY